MRNIKIKAGLLIIPAIFTLQGASQEETTMNPPDLFPPDNHVEGWSMIDSVRNFHPETFYLHVNEASGLLSEFGCRRSAEGVYTNSGSVRIDLEVFEMEKPDGAWGFFTMSSSGIGQETTVGDVALKYDYYIHFVKGNYYIRCTASNKDPQYLETVMQICKSVDGQITVHAKKPAILMALQFDDRETNRERYFMGQIGLNEVFDFGHGSLAGFSEGGSCRSGENLFFVLSYSDERKRREWFASARGKVKMSQNQRFSDYQMIEDGFTARDRNGNAFAFKPYKNHILIVKGFSWGEAAPVFKSMAGRLDEVGH